jgi:outer membrane protein assembly factor BamB
MIRLVSVVAVVGIVALSHPAHADNWPQWRGPQGTGVSTETNLSHKWSDDSGLAWKTALPEWGRSTPVIWNDALFVTSEADGRLLLLRVDAKQGGIVWTRDVGEGTPTRSVPGGGKRTAKFHDLHNLASPSVATDGEVVIAHFGNGDLAGYTFDGQQLWKRNLAHDHGEYTIWWGHANSPVLYRDLVISVCMQDSLDGDTEKLAPSYLVAHHKRTGEVVWQTPRMTGGHAEECDAYTTPLLVNHNGQPTLVVMGGNWLDAYDPTTGKQTWVLPGLVGGRTITGPTVVEGLVLATIGMRGPLHAVRLGLSGKLAADSVVAWKEAASTPDSSCPVSAHGLVWMVTDNGIASCLRAKDGENLWRQRLPGRDYKASPVVADGKVFFLSKDGVTTVIAAKPEYEVRAENRLGDEFLASPAIANGTIFLRGRTALYAIRK